MVQLKSAGSVVEALSYMVKRKASPLQTEPNFLPWCKNRNKTMMQALQIQLCTKAKLSALVQESQQDDDAGAPDPAVYQSQSGGVVDTLNSLLDEAQTQLDQARATETADIQNFEMLR